MAASRLKILKNKKDTQIKQLRRELAHLLESGQTQTAKIRVSKKQSNFHLFCMKSVILNSWIVRWSMW